MRAFSLVELMVGIVIGLLVLVGWAQFSGKMVQMMGEQRRQMGGRGNLQLAHDELHRFLRRREPEFFERFPVNVDLVHHTDHIHGGVQVKRSCPLNQNTDCMIVWDIRPQDESPIIYDLVNSGDFPKTISINPSDPTYLPGPARNIGPMSVLMFASESLIFCALIEDVIGSTIKLANQENQPWPIPDLPIGKVEVVHLGVLEATHIGLIEDKDRNYQLSYTPWKLENQQWEPQRRRNSYSHLESMTWQACSEETPDRMVIFSQGPRPKKLKQTINIAGRSFQEEVFHASLEF